MLLVLALSQSLGAGATSLIARALGRRDRDQAELVLNQALALAVLGGLAFGAVAFPLRGAYTRSLAADAATAAQGIAYLDWFIPALMLQLPLVVMGAALRGMGDVKLPTLISVGTVVLNILLAPMLIFGWPLGARSARRARRSRRWPPWWSAAPRSPPTSSGTAAPCASGSRRGHRAGRSGAAC